MAWCPRVSIFYVFRKNGGEGWLCIYDWVYKQCAHPCKEPVPRWMMFSSKWTFHVHDRFVCLSYDSDEHSYTKVLLIICVLREAGIVVLLSVCLHVCLSVCVYVSRKNWKKTTGQKLIAVTCCTCAEVNPSDQSSVTLWHVPSTLRLIFVFR